MLLTATKGSEAARSLSERGWLVQELEELEEQHKSEMVRKYMGLYGKTFKDDQAPPPPPPPPPPRNDRSRKTCSLRLRACSSGGRC